MFKTTIYSFFYDFGIQSVVTLTQRSFLSATTAEDAAVGWTQPNLLPSLALKVYSKTCCACRLHCFCGHGYILPPAPGTIFSRWKIHCIWNRGPLLVVCPDCLFYLLWLLVSMLLWYFHYIWPLTAFLLFRLRSTEVSRNIPIPAV